MLRRSAFAMCGVSLALSTPCLGTGEFLFTGIVVNEYRAGGKLVADVYVGFDPSGGLAPKLLNVFNVQTSLAGGFEQLHHDDLFPGPTWAPQFTTPGMELMDSFVTIGGSPGFMNFTGADPNWGPSGFDQAGIPPLAGWFNSNPPNFQGEAQAIVAMNLQGQVTYTGLGTHVMRMVIDEALVGDDGRAFSFHGAMTWNLALGSGTLKQQPFGFDTTLWVIPTPGAAVLLVGLAGVGGRRRRDA